jgi:hypothetical protein
MNVCEFFNTNIFINTSIHIYVYTYIYIYIYIYICVCTYTYIYFYLYRLNTSFFDADPSAGGVPVRLQRDSMKKVIVDTSITITQAKEELGTYC